MRPALVVLLAGLCACSDEAVVEADTADQPPSPEAARDWPDGTVLAVGEVPIDGAEVDEFAAMIAELYPGNVSRQNRRLALTNFFLERAAVASRDHERRERALAVCREARERLVAGDGTVEIERVRGGFRELDQVALWARARVLEPGRWSAPIDLVGRWVLMRVESREPGAGVHDEWIELDVATFPYLDLSYHEVPEAYRSVQEAVDRARLEVVDPAWTDTVPWEWRLRMQ